MERRDEEWSKTLRFALRPQHPGDGRWTEEQRDEMNRIQENDPKREEKLQKRREMMMEKLEEAKDYLWKIKDDKDFENKSE